MGFETTATASSQHRYDPIHEHVTLIYLTCDHNCICVSFENSLDNIDSLGDIKFSDHRSE